MIFAASTPGMALRHFCKLAVNARHGDWVMRMRSSLVT
jgi:hypothetical protein